MLDFMGQEVAVGDYVVVSRSYKEDGQYFRLGKIKRINKEKNLLTLKWVWPEPENLGNTIISLGNSPSTILKVSEEIVVAGWLTGFGTGVKNESH